MRAKELIAALGGTATVAAKLGVTPSAVSHWVRDERIPARHWMTLWALAQAAGVAWAPPGVPAQPVAAEADEGAR